MFHQNPKNHHVFTTLKQRSPPVSSMRSRSWRRGGVVLAWFLWWKFHDSLGTSGRSGFRSVVSGMASESLPDFRCAQLHFPKLSCHFHFLPGHSLFSLGTRTLQVEPSKRPSTTRESPTSSPTPNSTQQHQQHQHAAPTSSHIFHIFHIFDISHMPHSTFQFFQFFQFQPR